MREASKFELLTRVLEGPLSRTTVISEEEVVATENYQSTLNGILSSEKKRAGRTDEAIRADVLTGKVAECGIAKLLKVDVFDEEWVLKDRSSYAKDVVYKGLRIEVKSTNSLRGFYVSTHGHEQLVANAKAHLIDALLFAHRERASSEGFWIVTPTLIVDPYPEGTSIDKLWHTANGGFTYAVQEACSHDICHPLIDLGFDDD